MPLSHFSKTSSKVAQYSIVLISIIIMLHNLKYRITCTITLKLKKILVSKLAYRFRSKFSSENLNCLLLENIDRTFSFLYVCEYVKGFDSMLHGQALWTDFSRLGSRKTFDMEFRDSSAFFNRGLAVDIFIKRWTQVDTKSNYLSPSSCAFEINMFNFSLPLSFPGFYQLLVYRSRQLTVFYSPVTKTNRLKRKRIKKPIRTKFSIRTPPSCRVQVTKAYLMYASHEILTSLQSLFLQSPRRHVRATGE